MFKRIYLAITLLFLGSTVYAQGYVGLGIGKVSLDEDLGDYEDPTGFELIGGTEINRNLSFELSYIDFGDATENFPFFPFEISADSIAAGVLVRGKAGQTADVFIKAGMHSWDFEATIPGIAGSFTDSGTDLFYGFGIMIKTSDKFSMGAKYTIYNFDDIDVSMFSINGQVSF